ncbi:uncharacterized protein LOC105847469 isoform X2 [Hydra vulgaris]|uniref:uncharacterized protein LOC105847469 isoform X2 n=1 Tax=Hydra vulgaris TaxID=6087 RepID=UPI001F5F7170|nr:uncharacterized protein LOC105847469 isoform X2 [Hydra vulgaris]
MAEIKEDDVPPLEDDVPPLEDLSDIITKFSPLNFKNSYKTNEYLEATDNENDSRTKKINTLLQAPTPKKTFKSEDVKNEKTSYCGFKKGFLLKEDKSMKKVIEIKKENVKDKNIIEEVQSAMFKQKDSKDWITNDLLEKISAHPTLSKQFFDRRFGQIISQFQKNPNDLMAIYKNDAEVLQFIREFSILMSNHFINLAKKEDRQKKIENKKKIVIEESTNLEESIHQRFDDEEVNRIISNPEMVSILQCKEIRHFFFHLKSNPSKAQKLLNSANSDMRYKIQKLVDAGLLQMS